MTDLQRMKHEELQALAALMEPGDTFQAVQMACRRAVGGSSDRAGDSPTGSSIVQ
jgi:hypothetical protein